MTAVALKSRDHGSIGTRCDFLHTSVESGTPRSDTDITCVV